MKITNKQLKKIIKEELKNLILEFNSPKEREDRFIQHLIETMSSLIYAKREDFEDLDSGFFESHTSAFQHLVDVGILNNVTASKGYDYDKDGIPDSFHYEIEFPKESENERLSLKILVSFAEYAKRPDMDLMGMGPFNPKRVGEECIIRHHLSLYDCKIFIDIERKRG